MAKKNAEIFHAVEGKKKERPHGHSFLICQLKSPKVTSVNEPLQALDINESRCRLLRACRCAATRPRIGPEQARSHSPRLPPLH
jgi:hypothetical protein